MDRSLLLAARQQNDQKTTFETADVPQTERKSIRRRYRLTMVSTLDDRSFGPSNPLALSLFPVLYLTKEVATLVIVTK